MTAVTITNHDGSKFVGCECIAAVWDDLNAEARARGIVINNFDVMQGAYSKGVPQSAKTHWYGGVIDIRWISLSDINKIKAQYQLLDEFGFDPFRRGPISYDTFSPHIHMVMRGCPHVHIQAAIQATSWLAGRDGLVRNWKDRDYSWRVTSRSWTDAVKWYQGIATVRAQAAIVANAPQFSYSHLMVGITGAGKGKFNGNVALVQRQLNRSGWSKKIKGYTLKENGIWDSSTQAVFAGYQKQGCGFKGLAANGIPGFTSTTRLMGWFRNPFKVVK